MSAEKKHRLLHDQRDMLLSLAPLVGVCLLIAGLAGKCSFSPTAFSGPQRAVSEMKDVDAQQALRDAARYLPFDVRIPQAPTSWRTIAVDRGEIRTGSVPSEQISVNYLSPAGRAYRLTQTDALVSAVIAWLGFDHETVQATHPIGDVKWVVSSEDSHVMWLWDDGHSRVAITAMGGREDAFELLAAAVGTAPIVPRTGSS